MKAKIFWIVMMLLGLTGSASYAQQEFTFTTTPANLGGIKASIDMPGLSGNPLAIIVATPLGNTETLNPHPIGVWYSSDKWNLVNVDSGRMPPDAKYKIQFFLKPGPNQFLHIFTQQNIGAEGSYIDNPALNNNPNAQIQILQNHAPDIRSPYNLNRVKAKAAYSTAAGKWYITNVNGELQGRGTAYNIVITSGAPVGTNLVTNPNDPNTNQPPIPPTANAGGDLSGNYPNPTVKGLQGRPLSTAAPTVGQMLRWNGTEWEPVTINSEGTTFNTGLGLYWEGGKLQTASTQPMWNAGKLAGRDIMTTDPNPGQVLKWNGSAWYPADDNSSTSVAPTTTPTKPSVLYFNQNLNVRMDDPNVNTLPIGGLDNQIFTLAQSSRVVFHTVIEAEIGGAFQSNATGVTLKVEILNSSNAVVARALSLSWLTRLTLQTMKSSGIGILPAGTYHTKVTIIRQAGGSVLEIYRHLGDINQGGQMIIEIFPE